MAVRDQQVGVVWPPGRSDNLLISLSLSGDLNYLVEGTPELRQVISGHQKSITSLNQTTLDNKETLWTGSFDGRVCSWDVSSGTAAEIEGESHPATLLVSLPHQRALGESTVSAGTTPFVPSMLPRRPTLVAPPS